MLTANVLRNRVGWNKVVVVIFCTICQLSGQSQTDTKGSRQLSPQTVQTLLRKPRGLEAAAALVGHLVIDNEPEVWARPPLSSLVQTSSLIEIGTIKDFQCKLGGNGNYIKTIYVLHPTKMIKGVELGDTSFGTRGGKVAFSNGTTAEEITISWQQLQIGQTYIVMLKKDPIQGYLPVNGIESFFKVSLSDGSVKSLASYHDGLHQVTKEVEGLSLSALLDKISMLSPVK